MCVYGPQPLQKDTNTKSCKYEKKHRGEYRDGFSSSKGTCSASLLSSFKSCAACHYMAQQSSYHIMLRRANNHIPKANESSDHVRSMLEFQA